MNCERCGAPKSQNAYCIYCTPKLRSVRYKSADNMKEAILEASKEFAENCRIPSFLVLNPKSYRKLVDEACRFEPFGVTTMVKSIDRIFGMDIEIDEKQAEAIRIE